MLLTHCWLQIPTLSSLGLNSNWISLSRRLRSLSPSVSKTLESVSETLLQDALNRGLNIIKKKKKKIYEFSIMWGCCTTVEDWKPIPEIIPTSLENPPLKPLFVLVFCWCLQLASPWILFLKVIFILCGYVALCALWLKCFVASMFWNPFCTSPLVIATTRTRRLPRQRSIP